VAIKKQLNSLKIYTLADFVERDTKIKSVSLCNLFAKTLHIGITHTDTYKVIFNALKFKREPTVIANTL